MKIEMATNFLSCEPILIVDDEPANLKLLNKLLSLQGYTNLMLIQDARQVIDACQSFSPSLILLDLNMPHMSGFQIMKTLNSLNNPLAPPVIILTAQHGNDYLLEALSLGARDFLTKPFNRVELLMRVRNLLEAHQAHLLLHDQKVMLEQMVKIRTEELHSTRLQIVRRLGQAAEFRDNDTGMHILRMSQISVCLAKALGWDDNSCDLLLNASPMHDVGKIGIPDAILLKPGKLDIHEWEIMKTHATIGGRLLEGDNSDLISMARDIALTHHERWDGTGYPNRLAGKDIPLSGRIVAVADVFDALTSDRPYKKAWEVKDAIELINTESGKHFDPDIVIIFNKILHEIVEIIQTHKESIQ